MKTWLLTLPMRAIMEMANFYRVEPALIAAVVSVESDGNACATRYENHYRWLLDEERFARLNQTTVDTEAIHQKTSWGLMQVMGAVAREHGFKGPMVELCQPKVGLKYGILHLTKFIDKYDDLEEAISAYNQGGAYRTQSGLFKNQSYVDKIMKRYKVLKNE